MSNSGYLIWNVRPEIFDLGYFSPRWYGLFFAAGFLLGNAVATKIFRAEGRNEKSLSTLLIYIVLGTVIGARLGHCLLYEPERYLSHPWEILNLREGGLASHGGFTGVMIAIALFLRKHREMSFLELADRLTVPALIGAVCIRVGNFFNSEMYGPSTTVPWAVIFSSIDDKPRHPSMLYEAISYFFILSLLYALYFRTELKKTPGRILGLALALCFLARFLIEFVKVDQVDFESGMLLNMGQILSIPFILVGVVLAVRRQQTVGSKVFRKRMP